ncbi:hypothetical protein ONS95_008214 [Cadophora gregata]|uniref:uncharacterized protein n=1 Tax=Cadophora gregata TaxID=51156 RepID=UPI0026DACCD3|nr:uncharacterized protein ONS95_008214 [Cadophora gregata]KAK0126628.1 hypothetical protein ONS95_008214 [Cadophora gregata]
MAGSSIAPGAANSARLGSPEASKRRSSALRTKGRATISNPASMVTLTTGSGHSIKNFVVHKNFACHYSPVLRAAFDSNFIEGQTQVYHFQDTEETVVILLVNWLYSQSLVVKSLKSRKSNDTDDMKLFRLWVLADRLLIPRLQNAVMSKLYKMEEIFLETIDKNNLGYIYNNTAKGGSLRQLVLQQFVLLDDPIRVFSKGTGLFPKEMLI